MKKLLIIPLAFVLLMGAGCNQPPVETTNELESETISETETAVPDYVGTWFREQIIVDGVPEVGPVDANLVFEEDGKGSFHSETDLCYVDGTVEVTGNSVHMLTDESDCPAEAVAMTSDITYEYEVSEDGQTYTHTTVFSGVTITEVYSRVSE